MDGESSSEGTPGMSVKPLKDRLRSQTKREEKAKEALRKEREESAKVQELIDNEKLLRSQNLPKPPTAAEMFTPFRAPRAEHKPLSSLPLVFSVPRQRSSSGDSSSTEEMDPSSVQKKKSEDKKKNPKEKKPVPSYSLEFGSDGLPIPPMPQPNDTQETYQMKLLYFQSMLNMVKMKREEEFATAQLEQIALSRHFRVEQKLGHLEKFSLKLYEEGMGMSFATWIKQFQRFTKTRCHSNEQFLQYLNEWVADECWVGWNEKLSAEELADADFLVKKLTNRYPDKTTEYQREERFKAYKQKTDDVLVYSEKKEVLYLNAFPLGNVVLDARFYEGWKAGLWEILRTKLAHWAESHGKKYLEGREMLIKWTKIEKEERGGYGDFKKKLNEEKLTSRPKNDQKSQKKDIECRFWKKDGSCTLGDECKFKHSPRPKEKSDMNSSKSKSQSTKEGVQLDITEKVCSNKECQKEKDKHLWIKCPRLKTQCYLCKQTGHTKYLCPQADCTKCNRKGHLAEVCGQQAK